MSDTDTPTTNPALIEPWKGIRMRVAKFNYFDEWDEETITKLCRVSKIKRFKCDEIILGAKSDLTSYVYFVTEGCCRVIECLHLAARTKKGVRTRTCFVNICTLHRLSCFNIGENLKDRQIVAITDTECLLIPFYWLLERNTANIWMRIKQFLIWKIPETTVIVQNLRREEKWAERKTKMAQAKMKRQVETIGNHDVPYSLKVRY